LSGALAAIALHVGLAAAAFAAQEARDREPAAEHARTRSSVLLITLDTTRRDVMGFLGRDPSPTPNLDALAASSIVFTDAVTTAPLTLPAHASLLTGLYPVRHGVHDNGLYRLSGEARTLAEILQEQGYATRAAVAAFVLDPLFGLDQGFDRYRAPPRGASGARTLRITERRAKEMVDLALADLVEIAGPAPSSGTSGEPRPFFYWLHLFDPHAPYDPPAPPPRPPSADPADVLRALYEAEIAAMDGELGRLFDELKRRGLFDRLLVVVAADHGESLGDGRETSHGHFLFDPTVRVPLLLRDPRLAPARVDAPASLVDVVPTLLARLGVDARGERFDGLDLSPWLVEPKLAPPDRVLALESWYVWLHYGWAPFEGATLGALKFVRSQHEELFDRAVDPREAHDLFTADDERAIGIARRLDALRDASAAIAGERTGLSQADRAALQALGYATGGSSAERPAGDWSTLPDAYEKLDVLRGFDEFVTAIERGEFPRAVERMRDLAAKEPASALFHEQLGLMLINLGPQNADEAERELRRALELDPRGVQTWFALARCALAHRDASRAEARKLREQGDAAGAREPARVEREQEALAERALRECLRLEPTYPDGLIELARLLFDQAERAARRSDRDGARARFDEIDLLAQRLIEIVPRDAPEAAEAAEARRIAGARKAALGQ